MFIFVALSGITAQSVIGYNRWVKPVGCQSRHWHRFGNGGRVRESIRNMVLVCIAAKGTAHVACVCARACARACVRAHFCACVRACLRVCVRVYAHLNMRMKFTKHSGHICAINRVQMCRNQRVRFYPAAHDRLYPAVISAWYNR